MSTGHAWSWGTDEGPYLTGTEHLDAVTWYMIQGKDCEISIEPRPSYCDRGSCIAKLHPKPGSELARSIDHQDGWPRYYFDFPRAMEEIAAWLMKRDQLPD